MGKYDPEIKIENLSVEFPDNKNGNGQSVIALSNINLEIKQGEFVTFVGPSGCGKTTLLRTIADLQQPTSGSIVVRGHSPREIRVQRKYGIVFQSPVLYDWRTVRRNVCMPMEIVGIPKKQRTEIVTEMLELVGLYDFGKKYPHELSGGMQQRVGIARALAIKPEILLMDEPFSALDEFTKEKLHEDLLKIWAKTNKTILFVTAQYCRGSLSSLTKWLYCRRIPAGFRQLLILIFQGRELWQLKIPMSLNALVAKVRNSFEGVFS